MIRILSCNLFFGNARPAALLDLIARESIDVVCAQELSPSLAAALQECLPHGDMVRPGLKRDNGIAARRPVTLDVIAMPGRAARIATLTPEHWPQLRQPLQLVNVHIQAPQKWPWFPNRVRRRDQLRMLLQDRAAAPCAYAIVGDFNASPSWPLYRRIAREHQDAAVLLQPRAAATWPAITPLGISGLFRIDHCFVKNLGVTSLRIVELPGSDHSGLLVDLAETAAAVK